MAPTLTQQWSAKTGSICGLLLLLLAGDTTAQLSRTSALEERQSALARVPSGQIVQLRLTDGQRAAGPVLRWSTYSVLLGPYLGYASQDTMLPLASIDTLWVRGRATRRGILYGGLAGTAVGAVLGATTSSICPDPERTEPCARGTLTSAVFGLAIGALTGGLLGSGNPEWRRLHPRGASRRLSATSTAVSLYVPGDSSVPDARTLALARVRSGRMVRLEFADRPDLVGYVTRGGARHATLVPVGTLPRETVISLASLNEVWERATASRTGSVVGAIAGVTAGAFVGAEATCARDCSRSSTMLANGILGGLAGWLLGGRVGSLIPKWERRF